MTKTAIPTKPEELEEFLSDQTKVMDLLRTDPGSFKDLMKNYGANLINKDNGLKLQLEDQFNSFTAKLADMLGKDSKILDQRVDDKPGHAYAPLYNKKAAGAKLDGMFDTLGDFVYNSWHRANRNEDMEKKFLEVKNYSERVPADGGFVVPEEFRAEIMKIALEKSLVRPRARVIPMGSATLSFPVNDVTSHAAHVFGGITVTRVGEGDSITPSSAKFARVKLIASKQVAGARVTNELMRDGGGAFDYYINQAFSEAVAFEEDYDFLTGSGADEPLGALSAQNPSLITVAKETNQTATTIVWENVIRMYARLHPAFADNAVWVASPDAFPELATMALVVGSGGAPVWITDATGKPRMSLLGLPLIPSEKAPAALGTQGDLSLAAFSGYAIGDRQMVTIDSSEHSRFMSDETEIRVTARNDGRPWVLAPITPRNGGATLSPFVQLATRS